MSQDNWKHRSDGMKCKTCMWFVEKDTSPKTEVGRCRRHAPIMNGYPVVFASDWCGDHKLDENRLVNQSTGGLLDMDKRKYFGSDPE